jgi:hypothetical protein
MSGGGCEVKGLEAAAKSRGAGVNFASYFNEPITR